MNKEKSWELSLIVPWQAAPECTHMARTRAAEIGWQNNRRPPLNRLGRDRGAFLPSMADRMGGSEEELEAGLSRALCLFYFYMSPTSLTLSVHCSCIYFPCKYTTVLNTVSDVAVLGSGSTHPGIAVGRSGCMAESLGWVFVVDFQAGVVCDVPVRGRGVQW